MIATGLAAIIVQATLALPPNEQSLDELLNAIEIGSASVEGVMELGSRTDPRILPIVSKAAAGYENRIVRAGREKNIRVDPWFIQFDIDVRFAAKQVAAKLGNKSYFEEFVVGLSTTNGYYKRDCIIALGYVGDRAAIRYLILLISDQGSPEKSTPGYDPGTYAHDALMQLRKLIPPDELPKSLKDSAPIEQIRADLRSWWKQRKKHYGARGFGKK